MVTRKVSKEVAFKLPKSKAAQEKLAQTQASKFSHYTFPTLTLRQAQILLDCIKLGIDAGVSPGDEYVTGDEWLKLIATLVNIK